MKTFLIIHGHFYQPPRENPYTGIVPDQITAKPFDNWNEAIYRTSYKPNAYSRYLDNNGKIKTITNNYSTISANFGPTLLSWFDEEHPDFIKKLIEADRESTKKLGHSNFIAQCYNHVILPLAKPYIRKIQIQWALDDFKKRFGHKSEGFWCSECAINKDVIDDLVDAGIKFVILSPWQAKYKGKIPPCDRPFLLKGNKRTISAFFYDPDLASGISFGHLLRNADNLFDILKNMRIQRNNPKLITCATDGEIYGHHEPFGDMALAALIKKVNESEEFEFTNYGAYLEKNPATEYAQLFEGDDHLGSSWSCSHGVGRWYKDCGCHTGGNENWNQSWRNPLRNAFDKLESQAKLIFDNEIETLLGKDVDSVSVLAAYSKVLTKQQTCEEFASSYNIPDNKKVDFATLLDAMKNIMFMYTSCGWFFNDLSGLEPRQNISYAIYASNALSRFTTKTLKVNLLKDLREAKSNISSEGTGEDIAKKDLLKIPSFAQATGFFALNRRVALEKDYTDTFGVYKLLKINSDYLEILHTRTLERFKLVYSTQIKDQKTFEISVKNLSTGYHYSFTSDQISHKSLRLISEWVDNNLSSCIDKRTIKKISDNIDNYIILINAEKSLSKDSIFYDNISLSMKAIRGQFIMPNDHNWDDSLKLFRNLVYFVRLTGRDYDRDLTMQIFCSQFRYYTRILESSKATDKIISHFLDLLELARQQDFDVDITSLQNEAYPIIRGMKKTRLSDDIILRLKRDLNFSEF